MSDIIQIAPANAGWFVSYKLQNGQICNLPVACWALCKSHEDKEVEPFTVVRPIVADGHGESMTEGDEDAPGCVDMGKYLGIIAPGETEVQGTVLRHTEQTTARRGQLPEMRFSGTSEETRALIDFVGLCVELDDYLPATLRDALAKIRPQGDKIETHNYERPRIG